MELSEHDRLGCWLGFAWDDVFLGSLCTRIYSLWSKVAIPNHLIQSKSRAGTLELCRCHYPGTMSQNLP